MDSDIEQKQVLLKAVQKDFETLHLLNTRVLMNKLLNHLKNLEFLSRIGRESSINRMKLSKSI